MTASAFPLEAGTRQTDVLTGDGATVTFGPFGFKIFSGDDVEVLRKDLGQARFAVTGNYTVSLSGAYSSFTITWSIAPPATSQFYVRGKRIQQRSIAPRKANQLDVDAVDKELTAIGVVQQEMTRDAGQAVTAERGVTPPVFTEALTEGRLLLAGPGSTLKNSSVPESDVAAIPARVAAAAASQAAAAASQAAAAGSATSAAQSAAAAENARSDARAAADATGNVRFFDTKAAANSGLAGLPEGQVVEIFADETQTGLRTRYVKTSGAYVFKLIMPETYTDLRRAPYATDGADEITALTSLGAPVRIKIKEVDITRHGASGDPAENATAFMAAAIAKLRNAGGGALLLPRGTYLTDGFDWDWLAGGYGKLHVIGDGVNSVVKKRLNDGVSLFVVGRNDTQQTFQGAVFMENFALDGFISGTEAVLDLWSLTTFEVRNVRARYGRRAIRLRNCVTGRLVNCQGSDSEYGLDIGKFLFPVDPPFPSDCNLITLDGGAYKDNSIWGIIFSGGSQLLKLGVQTEHNGTDATASGGMYVAPSAGDLGTNRKFRAVTSLGCWYENNSGYAAIALDGGASLFEGGGCVANDVDTWDLTSNGGLYTLVDMSMINSRPNGNILDASGAPIGNKIIGGQIVGVQNTNAGKTDLDGVNTGNGATPVILSRRSGRADIQSRDTTQQMVQAGLASGSSVTFGTPFTGTPNVMVCPAGNDSNKVKMVQVVTVSTTGFTVCKTEHVDGSDDVVASGGGDAYRWFAMGPIA